MAEIHATRGELGASVAVGPPDLVDDETVGALNLYSAIHTHLDADLLAHARLLAAQAALALSQSRREGNLRRPPTSRTIGIAIGLTMERFDIDDEQAFARLARLSQRTNVKLRDLAAHLVNQSNDLRHLADGSRRLVQQTAQDQTMLPPPDAHDSHGIEPTNAWLPFGELRNHPEVPDLLPEA